MGVIVVEGLVITVLVLTGFRESVLNAIPLDLKRAIGIGIGLFILWILVIVTATSNGVNVTDGLDGHELGRVDGPLERVQHRER